MATHQQIMSMLGSGNASRRAQKFGEASERLNEALGMCGPNQDYERALVYRELGELARNEHDLNAAQAHYEKAVALLRTSGDRLKFAHTIRHLADVKTDLRDGPDAERFYLEALDIYRNHPSPDSLDFANAIRARAAMLTKSGRHEEARPLWREAGDMYQSLGIAAGVEECGKRAGPAAQVSETSM